MPCACQKPEPAYPENDQWGPHLWRILHALAEHAGKPIQRTPAAYADEKRQWVNLMTTLPKMIPCDKCRAHATDYQAHIPFDLKGVSEDDLNEWIRTYLWEFHEHVNSGIGKPSFPKANLTPTYHSVSVSATLKSLTPFIETAIRLRGLTLFPWQNFTKYVRTLNSIYGL